MGCRPRTSCRRCPGRTRRPAAADRTRWSPAKATSSTGMAEASSEHGEHQPSAEPVGEGAGEDPAQRSDEHRGRDQQRLLGALRPELLGVAHAEWRDDVPRPEGDREGQQGQHEVPGRDRPGWSVSYWACDAALIGCSLCTPVRGRWPVGPPRGRGCRPVPSRVCRAVRRGWAGRRGCGRRCRGGTGSAPAR